MMRKLGRLLMIIAGATIVVGIIAIPMETVVNPKPEAQCEDGSDFEYSELNCQISAEEFDEIKDWETSVKWLRLLGAVLILLGVIGGIVGLILFIVGKGKQGDPNAPPAA